MPRSVASVASLASARSEFSTVSKSERAKKERQQAEEVEHANDTPVDYINRQYPHMVLAISWKHCRAISARLTSMGKEGIAITCILRNGSSKEIFIPSTGPSFNSLDFISTSADKALEANFGFGILECLILFMMFIVLPMLAFSAENDDIGPFEYFRRLQMVLIPYPGAAKIILYGAWMTHFFEGYAALIISRKMGLSKKQSQSWFWWSTLLGYPCFANLLALRSAKAAGDAQNVVANTYNDDDT